MRSLKREEKSVGTQYSCNTFIAGYTVNHGAAPIQSRTF